MTVSSRSVSSCLAGALDRLHTEYLLNGGGITLTEYLLCADGFTCIFPFYSPSRASCLGGCKLRVEALPGYVGGGDFGGGEGPKTVKEKVSKSGRHQVGCGGHPPAPIRSQRILDLGNDPGKTVIEQAYSCRGTGSCG